MEVDTDEPDPRKKLIIDEHMDVYPKPIRLQLVWVSAQRSGDLV